MLEQGIKAPDFSLMNDQGENVALNHFSGCRVVLYFYPKDDTPGCTRESREFTAALPSFKALNTAVCGISRDTSTTHARFRKKFDLKVVLLSDPQTTMLRQYGVIVQKSMFGKTYDGVARTTVLLDAQHQVYKIWNKVKVAGHVEEVLRCVQSMPSSS